SSTSSPPSAKNGGTTSSTCRHGRSIATSASIRQDVPLRDPGCFPQHFQRIDGMRFDVVAGELRRISGVRNIRQALASPYPVFHPRCGAAQFTVLVSRFSVLGSERRTWTA